MNQSKNAIGNLINRYRAVLKKCHLLNTFGSLAVVGMLVMGGGLAVGVASGVMTPGLAYGVSLSKPVNAPTEVYTSGQLTSGTATIGAIGGLSNTTTIGIDGTLNDAHLTIIGKENINGTLGRNLLSSGNINVYDGATLTLGGSGTFPEGENPYASPATTNFEGGISVDNGYLVIDQTHVTMSDGQAATLTDGSVFTVKNSAQFSADTVSITNGTLNIENGATLATTLTRTGSTVNVEGDLTQDAGRNYNISTFSDTKNTAGKIAVLDNGNFIVNKTLTLSYTDPTSNILTIANGGTIAAKELTFSDGNPDTLNDALTLAGGNLTLLDDGITNNSPQKLNGSLTIDAGESRNSNVTALGHWETDSSIVVNNGTLSVEHGATLTINNAGDGLTLGANGILKVAGESSANANDAGVLNIANSTVTANVDASGASAFGTINLTPESEDKFVINANIAGGEITANDSTTLTLTGSEGGILASDTVSDLKAEIAKELFNLNTFNGTINLEGYKDINEATLTDVSEMQAHVNFPTENIGAGTLSYKNVDPDTGLITPTTVAGIKGTTASKITGDGVHLVLTGQNGTGVLSGGGIQVNEGALLTLGSTTDLAPTTSLGTVDGYKNIVATGTGKGGLQSSVIVQNTNLTGNDFTLSDNASLAINNASLTGKGLTATASTVSVGDTNNASSLNVSTLTLSNGSSLAINQGSVTTGSLNMTEPSVDPASPVNSSHISLAGGVKDAPLATLNINGDVNFGNAQFITDPQQQPTDANSVYMGDYASLNVQGTFTHAGGSAPESPATLHMGEGATLSAQGLSLGNGVTFTGGNITLQEDDDPDTNLNQSINGALTIDYANSSLTIDGVNRVMENDVVTDKGSVWTTDSTLTIQNGNLVIAGGTLDIGGKNDAGEAIESGTLHFGSLSSEPTGSGDLSIAKGATLDLSNDTVTGNLSVFGTVNLEDMTFSKDTEDLAEGSNILGDMDTMLTLTYDQNDYQEVTQEELAALETAIAKGIFGVDTGVTNITIDGFNVFRTLDNPTGAKEGSFIGAGDYDPDNNGHTDNLTYSEIVGDRENPETTDSAVKSGTLNLTGSGDGDARMLSVGSIDVQGGTLNLGYDARLNAEGADIGATAGGQVGMNEEGNSLVVGTDAGSGGLATTNIHGANVSIVGNAMVKAESTLNVKAGAILDVAEGKGITLQGNADKSGGLEHMLAQLVIESKVVDGGDAVVKEGGIVNTPTLTVNEYSTAQVQAGGQLKADTINVSGTEAGLTTAGAITAQKMTIGASGTAMINADGTLTVKTEDGSGMLTVAGGASANTQGMLTVQGEVVADTLKIEAQGNVMVDGGTGILTATNIAMDGATDAESLLIVGDSTKDWATTGVVEVSGDITLNNVSQLSVQNGSLSAKTITANGDSVLTVGTEAMGDVIEATAGFIGSEDKAIESIALNDNSLLTVDNGTVTTDTLALGDTAQVVINNGTVLVNNTANTATFDVSQFAGTVTGEGVDGSITIGNAGTFQVNNTLTLSGGSESNVLNLYAQNNPADPTIFSSGSIAAQGYQFESATTLAGGHLKMLNDGDINTTQNITGALTIDTADGNLEKASVTIAENSQWATDSKLTITDGNLTVGAGASLNVEAGLTVGKDGTVDLGHASSLTASLDDFGEIDLTKDDQFAINADNLSEGFKFTAGTATLTLTGTGKTQFVDTIEELNALQTEIETAVFGDDYDVTINLNTVTVKAEDLSQVQSYYYAPEAQLAAGALGSEGMREPEVVVTLGGIAASASGDTDSVVRSGTTLNLTGLGAADGKYTPGKLEIIDGIANIGWDATKLATGSGTMGMNTAGESLLVALDPSAPAGTTAIANIRGENVVAQGSVKVGQGGLAHVYSGSTFKVQGDGVSVAGQDAQLLVEGSMSAKELFVNTGGLAMVHGGKLAVAKVSTQSGGALLAGPNAQLTLGTSDTKWLTDAIAEMPAQQSTTRSNTGFTAALGIHKPQVLASNGALVVDGLATDLVHDTAAGTYDFNHGDPHNPTTITEGTAYFADNSLLVVDATGVGNQAALSSEGGTLTVANGAKLHIVNGRAGQTVTVTEGFTNSSTVDTSAWGGGASGTGEVLVDPKTTTLSSSLIAAESVSWNADKGIYKVTLTSGYAPGEKNPYDSFASGSTAALINNLPAYMDTNSPHAGLMLVSRALTESVYEMGTTNPKRAVATIEGAAQLGAVGNVNKNAMDAANTMASAVWSRNSLTGMNTSATQVSGYNMNRGQVRPIGGGVAGGMGGGSTLPPRMSEGTAVWAMPLYKWNSGTGFEAGGLEHGYQNSMGGLAVGADYTYALDRYSAIRYGMALNVGAGVSESNGSFNTTTNGYDFWGITAYGAYQNENFVGSFDMGLTSMSSQVQQDLPGSMGMGNLDTAISSMVFTAGLNLEYTFVTEAVNITPHAGIRYMNVTTYDYDINSSAGLVGSSSQEDQGVWYFPVGVTLSKDFATGNGWVFTPKLDLGIVAALGNLETNTSTSLTGVDQGLSYQLKNVDGFAFNGGLGFELYNKRNGVSFGLNYNLQASEHDTGHMIFANFRYEF